MGVMVGLDFFHEYYKKIFFSDFCFHLAKYTTQHWFSTSNLKKKSAWTWLDEVFTPSSYMLDLSRLFFLFIYFGYLSSGDFSSNLLWWMGGSHLDYMFFPIYEIDVPQILRIVLKITTDLWQVSWLNIGFWAILSDFELIEIVFVIKSFLAVIFNFRHICGGDITVKK